MTRLNLAVVGAGQWGPNLIRHFYLHPECSLNWICEVDENRLEALKGKYGGVQFTRDWQQLIERKDLDAIVISTPSSAHFQMASEALQSGKHVFVEKPMATDFDQALDLAHLADRAGLKLMIGHVFLFNPGVQYLKKLVEEEELGELYYLYSNRTNFGPIRTDVNALWDLGPHDVSIMLHLFQKIPLKVRGLGSSFINEPIEDVVFANAQFQGGVMANMHFSWLDPKKVRQLVLVSSKKMVVFDDMLSEGSVRIYNKRFETKPSLDTVKDTMDQFRQSIVQGEVSVPELSRSEPLQNECHAFVDWALHDVVQSSDGIFGASVVYLLEKISHSMAMDGVPVKLLETELRNSDQLSGRRNSIHFPSEAKMERTDKILQ